MFLTFDRFLDLFGCFYGENTSDDKIWSHFMFACEVEAFVFSLVTLYVLYYTGAFAILLNAPNFKP